MTDSGDETARRSDVLSRRTLLQAGIAAPAGLALFSSHALRPTAKPAKRVAEVIVIGSGLSGLGAAAALQALQYDVLVLEGRSRIGGRTWTSTALNGVPLDVGASTIHGASGNPISDLAQRAHVETVPVAYDNTVQYDAQGYPIPAAEMAEWRADLALVRTKLQAAQAALTKSGEPDISVAAGLAGVLSATPTRSNPVALLDALNVAIAGRYAADTADLSLLHYDDGRAFPGTDVMLRTGFGPIVRDLAVGLDIRLSHIVRRIDTTSGGVTVTTNHGHFHAKRAVLTVPLAVLQQSGIVFTPALPSRKVSALARLRMGVLDRVYLVFAQRFWPAGAQMIGYLPSVAAPLDTWYPLDDLLGHPVLLGLDAGTIARTVESTSDDEVVAAAMTVLRGIYGSSVQDPVGHLITRWAADPLTGGAFSYAPVGADGHEHAILSEPVGDRLYFAGEHTSADFPGTVHGAYLSGVREAQRIDGV